MPQTPLSALIITHRGGALLARGLAALRPQLGPLDTLHVAVSNVPGAADLSACAAFGAEVLHLGENVGFAKAANLGLAACARALILLLNDDTAPLPGFIDALRAAAAARPGLYQPRILLSDGSGRLDNTGHGLFPDGFNWARGREDHDSAAYDLPGEVGACSGAALLVHRDVLDAIGPFDEDLEAFGEDVDLSLRARRRGFPLIYVPEARIVHDLGATYGRYTPRKVFLVERNRVRAAIRAVVVAEVAFNKYADDAHTIPDTKKSAHVVRQQITLTNAVTGVYEAISHSDSGEAAPTGVACRRSARTR